MKHIAIVVDDSKVTKFKHELEEMQIDGINLIKLQKNLTIIDFYILESRFVEVTRLCIKLEIDIKNSN